MKVAVKVLICTVEADRRVLLGSCRLLVERYVRGRKKERKAQQTEDVCVFRSKKARFKIFTVKTNGKMFRFKVYYNKFVLIWFALCQWKHKEGQCSLLIMVPDAAA